MQGRVKVSVFAISLVAAVSIAAPASAGHAVESRVTIKSDGFASFHGRVISRSAFCRQNRRVWLVGRYSDGVHPIDFVTTNKRGRWKQSTQLQGASRVRALASPKRRTGLRCPRARSRWVTP